MSATDKRDFGRVLTTDTIAYVGVCVVSALVGVPLGALYLAYRLDGANVDGFARRVVDGEFPWTTGATVILIVFLIIITMIIVIPYVRRVRRRGSVTRVDVAAEHMGTDHEFADMSAKGQEREAKRKNLTGGIGPGMVMTLSGMMLHATLEGTHTIIAGPRSGKSSSFTIPIVCEARGVVLSTSNKPDVLRATRHMRAKRGRVRLFDPSGIAKESPAMFWNPLTYIAGDMMDMRAARLAHQFAFSTGTATKGGDYFDITGEGLVASLMLAAAVGRYDIGKIREWLQSPTDPTPARLLSNGQFEEAAVALKTIQNLTPEQRDGVYGTANTMTKVLTYKSVQPWITRGSGREEFVPEDFVRSTGDTLYALSSDGHGSMSPLVTALTVCVTDAAEEYALSCPGERLPVPMALVLDEVANTCKWSDLPAAYSHFGSKGIIIYAFFQSWSQGANVWGDAGMKSLWSHSRTKIIGAGISENGFHESVSHMVGDYKKASHSTSRSERGRSLSVTSTKDIILSVADLTALPENRAVLVQTGHRPVLVALVPWWNRPYADELRAKPEPAAIPGNGVRAYDRPLSPVSPERDTPTSKWSTL